MTTGQPDILIVGDFLSGHGGSRGVCEELALRLYARGWQVTTASTRPNRVLRLLDMLWTTWHSRKQYAVAQIDVFSGPAFVWAEAVCWLLGSLRKPYVLTLHGGNLPSFAERWPGRVHRLIRSAAAVTTPSCYLKQTFSEIRDDILLLRNAVDLSAYQYRPRPKPAPRLAWLRAFHSIYNPSLAAETLALLVAEFPDIELTMFGPDKGDGSRGAMEAWAKSANVAHRIHAPGPIPKSEVPSALAPYDIFLNTTNVDNTPVSVIEAMACGLCIVSTNAGGVPYLLEDECDALLVPPNDPDAMANAVRRILTEPGLAERLSRNARARAEQFDWAAVLPQWEQLLIDIAQQNRT